MLKQIFFTLILAGCSPAFAQNARVLDGDTLKILSVKHRFWGVDAFEKSQTCHDVVGEVYACGLEAKKHLERLTRGKIVTCEPTGVPSYDRMVSRCYVGDQDLALLMVQAGWAFDYPNYSRGAYRQAQSIAQVKQRGAYAGHYQNPRDYRTQQKEF
jgi:endonuclease YncB( thermonuclease family)